MTALRAIVLASAVAPSLLAGRSVREHALGRLADAGVEPVPAASGNAAAVVARAIADGSIPRDEPFFLIDGGVAWFDGPVAALSRLRDGFHPGRVDGMLLLARITDLDANAVRDGLALDPLGVVRRPGEREMVPFVFAGVQLLSPGLFDDADAADLGTLWDRAIARGRLGGLVHDGVWFSFETARDVEAAGHAFEDRMAGIRL